MTRPILFWVGSAIVAGSIIAYCTGCASATRAQARGAVLATAEAVKIGDETCAKIALEKSDIDLARICENAYAEARSSLVVAASGVDAWDEGKRGAVTCAVVHSAQGLTTMASAIRKRGASVPPIVDDSLHLVNALGGCHE